MSALVPTDATGAFRLAEMMSTGKLVPTHLQRSPGDCLMVIEQAMRWGMSPFAVAQCTSVIQGKLMFEGKLVAAAIQSCGILADRFNYEFTGEGDRRVVTVSATIKGETKPRTIELALKDAKTTNGMWTKQPDQQLVYAGTRVWGRRHTPEVMLGVYSPEEMEPNKDTFVGTTIEAKAEVIPSHPQEPVATAAPTKKGKTWADLLADIQTKAANAQDEDAVSALGNDPDVKKVQTSAGQSVKDELAAILGDAYQRVVEANMQRADEPVPTE